LTFLARGRPCQGCGVRIIFKPDPENGGKMRAYDQKGSHKCTAFEELKRLGSDQNLLQCIKTMIAMANAQLRHYRVDYSVRELEYDN